MAGVQFLHAQLFFSSCHISPT